MKDITTVSLSGISITIDTDAYQVLQSYITELQKACDSEPESGAEIIEDIEARIAELLLSNKSYPASPISIESVEEVIAQMGHVEDIPFDDTSEKKERPSQQEPKESNMVSNIRRRIYRNSDGAKLGGVLNGIATFFNIDVTLVRIIYLILVGMAIFWWHSGLFIPLFIVGYFVLWIIIPSAKTPRQKLEMEGATITANSIRSNMRQELDKRGGKTIKNEKTASIITDIIYVLGRIVRFVVYAILAVIAVCIAILVMATLFTGIAGTEMLYSIGGTYSSVSPEFFACFTETSPKILYPLLSVCLAAPLIFILYSLISVLFSMKWNKIFTIIISSIWILSWLVGGVLLVKEIRRYNVGTSDITQEQITATPVKELYVLSTFSSSNSRIDEIDLNDLEITYRTTTDSIPSISIQKYARGRNFTEAQQNAIATPYNYHVSGDTLYLPSTIFETPLQQGQYHKQKVSVTIYAPEFTDVYLSKKLKPFLEDIDLSLSKNGYLLLGNKNSVAAAEEQENVDIEGFDNENHKKVEIEANNESKSFKIKVDDEVVVDINGAKVSTKDKKESSTSKSGNKREIIDI